MSGKIFVLSRVDRLKVMREGHKAQAAGKATTDCPYAIDGDGKAAAQAAAWVRGYVLAQNDAADYEFDDEVQD